MYVLILLFLTQTLAPSPINFKEERIAVEGKTYVVRNQKNRITITEERTWPIWLKDRMDRERKNHINAMFKPPKRDWGCLQGCLIVVGFSLLFWGTIIYLIWRNW